MILKKSGGAPPALLRNTGDAGSEKLILSNQLLADHGQENIAATGNKTAQSAIFLFGEMQVIDKNGMDITRQFTPLIKELFLIILLYTLDKGRGSVL